MQLTVGPLMFIVSYWQLSSQQNACTVISLIILTLKLAGECSSVSADSVGRVQGECINCLMREKSAFGGFPMYLSPFEKPLFTGREIFSCPKKQMQKGKVSTASQTVQCSVFCFIKHRKLQFLNSHLLMLCLMSDVYPQCTAISHSHKQFHF